MLSSEPFASLPTLGASNMLKVRNNLSYVLVVVSHVLCVSLLSPRGFLGDGLAFRDFCLISFRNFAICA
jgi:hypothetical protein